MNFLLYHKKTRPTGRTLAQALGVDSGVELRQTPHTLIRWGNPQFPDFDGRAAMIVNSASAICTAGDKLRAFRVLSDAGISIPEFQTTPFGDGGVYLARKRHGFGGRDITVCDRPGQHVEGAEFYTRYIPNDREYRLHVVGGEVVRLQRKYLDHPELRHSDYIKNHKNGYVFKTPQRTLRQSRLNTAVESVRSLGLDFGAVDAIIAPDETMYVLEVNTAPACSPLTAQAYTNALRRFLNG